MLKRRSSSHVSLAVLALAAAPVSLQAQTVTPGVFTDPHPVVSGGTIGFAYAGDMFVGSVQRDGTGALYSTNLTGGNVQVFAPSVNLATSPSSEHFVASSLGLGGFPNRDVYVASGTGIMHITHSGASSDPFVTGLAGNVRGILFDAVGSFGHDMLVTTDSGNIYRINSAGSVSLLASVGEDTEGLDVAPLGVNAAWHPGELIVASEGTGTIRAISAAGGKTTLAHVDSAEELTFVPLDLGASGNPVEGFYGANYTENVLKADASQFVGAGFDYRGDVLVTGETSHLINLVHWNGSAFNVSTVGQFPNQPEDGIFVTADIVRGSSVPEPGAMAMLAGVAVPGLLLLRKRRA